jgi:hypothetical protein
MTPNLTYFALRLVILPGGCFLQNAYFEDDLCLPPALIP